MDGADRDSLTWLTFEAPVLAPELLFDHLAARSADALFWCDGRELTVAAGAAAVATGHGNGRWHQLRRRAAAIFRRLDDDAGRGPAPRLFGGLAFRAGDTTTQEWQDLGDARFVLPQWLYHLEADGTTHACVVLPSRQLATRSARRAAIARLRRGLERFRRRLAVRTSEVSGPPRDVATPDADDWQAAVESAQAAMAAGRLRKVVATRPFEVRFDRRPAPGAVLRALDRSGGGPAVRFAFHRTTAGRGATFLGRTPERLVAVAGRHLRSEALAGTAEAGPRAASALLASAKDALEHRLVVDEIAARLRPLCDRLLHDATPRLRTASGVQHLVTPIEGESRTQVHLLDAARRLHPTPAVCGLPRAGAERWIARHESHARGWYSGAVGHFDAAGDGELRVALRCALLGEDAEGPRATVWAGAGLVPGSESGRELQEIRLKAGTLLDAFDQAAREAPQRLERPHLPSVHLPFTRLA